MSLHLDAPCSSHPNTVDAFPSLEGTSSPLTPPYSIEYLDRCATIIKRALRKRRTPNAAFVNWIDKSLPSLIHLSTEKFKALLRFIKRKYSASPSLELNLLHRKVVEVFQHRFARLNRIACSENRGITQDPKTGLPLFYTLEPHETKREEFVQRPPWIPTTKAELDPFARQIASLPNFLWDYERDGCYARAAIILHILQLMGLPKSMLCRQCVFISPELLKAGEWRYHVAVRINLTKEDGSLESWILDPLSSPTGVLSIHEWCYHYRDRSARDREISLIVLPITITEAGTLTMPSWYMPSIPADPSLSVKIEPVPSDFYTVQTVHDIDVDTVLPSPSTLFENPIFRDISQTHIDHWQKHLELKMPHLELEWVRRFLDPRFGATDEDFKV